MDVHRHDTEAPWYTSLWFLLVVIALVALLIAWSTSGRAPSRVEEAQAAPPAQVGPGQDQSSPWASPSDQPPGGSQYADRAVPL